MSFLRRIFGGEIAKNQPSDTPPVPTPSAATVQPDKQIYLPPEPNKPTVWTRRNFLRGMGAVAGVAVAGKIVGACLPEALAGETGEIKKVNIDGWVSKIYEAAEQDGISEILMRAPDKVTLTEQDQLRQWFIDMYPYQGQDEKNIRNIIYSATVANNEFQLSEIYQLLRRCDCHGFIYRFAAEYTPTDEQEKLTRLTKTKNDFYAVRATDYLPTANQIEKRDIDPRLWYQTLELTDKIHTITKQQIEYSIAQNAGWSEPTLVRAFKKILDNPAVRQKLTAIPELTLAEAFSLVKAVIRRTSIDSANREILTALDELLFERQNFQTLHIINPETKSVVYVYDSQLRQLVPTLQEKTDQLTRQQANFTPVAKSAEAKDKLLFDIIPASANHTTVFFFNTHGNIDTIGIGLNQETNLKSKELAQALLERVSNSGDKIELKKVILLIDACNSYGFAQNLIEQMRQQYSALGLHAILDTDFENIALPTIITATNDGGYALQEYGLYQAITLLPDEQPLTGAFLSRRTQSKMYQLAMDMTFFVGKTGVLIEIGQKNQQNNAVTTQMAA